MRVRDDRAKGDWGFTLAEVLVAMAIFSIAVMALLNSNGESVRASSLVEEKSFAEIVAENQLNLTLMSTGALRGGVEEGESQMAEQVWRWRQRVSPTSVPGFLRIDVEVWSEEGSRSGDGPVFGLVGFREAER